MLPPRPCDGAPLVAAGIQPHRAHETQKWLGGAALRLDGGRTGGPGRDKRASNGDRWMEPGERPEGTNRCKQFDNEAGPG
eukprot:6078901-Lingulodinium_polyedra.AAC.1